jgi:hypothetical protein
MKNRDLSHALPLQRSLDLQSSPENCQDCEALTAMPRSMAILCRRCRGLRVPRASLTAKALFARMAFSRSASSTTAAYNVVRRFADCTRWNSGGLRSDQIVMPITDQGCGQERDDVHKFVHAVGSIPALIAAPRQRAIVIAETA